MAIPAKLARGQKRDAWPENDSTAKTVIELRATNMAKKKVAKKQAKRTRAKRKRSTAAKAKSRDAATESEAKAESSSCIFVVVETGEQIELDLSFDEIMERQVGGYITLDDGRLAKRAVTEELIRDGKSGKPAKIRTRLQWPFHSHSQGVGVEQVDEANALLKSHGCTAHFDPQTGALVTTSQKQFDEVGKIRGFKTGRDGWENYGSSGRDYARARDAMRRIEFD